MLKKLPFYLLSGIAYGCTYFVGFCLVFYYAGNEATMTNIMQNFPTHAFGSMIVGIGFGTTSIVYISTRLSFLQQTLINYVVGMGTFFTVAYTIGWIPFGGVATVIFQLVLFTLMFLAIWACFYIYYHFLARQMNEKLSALPEDENTKKSETESILPSDAEDK